MGLAMAVGCTDGPSEGADTTTNENTGATTGNNVTDPTSDTDSDGLDFTTGSVDLTGGTTTGGTMMSDGGLQELNEEQIAAIKDGECSGVTAAAKPVPPVIELVVDVSLSMNEIAPGNGRKSRWDLARPALLNALDQLPDDVAVGLQLFPTSGPSQGDFGIYYPPPTDANNCVESSKQIPIAPLGPAGSMQRTAIANAMNQTKLYLGTPTHDAYHNALEDGLKTYEGPGDRFMLLMTDGAPTQTLGCKGDVGTAVAFEPIVAEAAAAAVEGVRTFVIGSPGSESTTLAGDTRPFLSELAQVGETGAENCSTDGPSFCHFDMTQSPDFSAALADGLAAISDQVTSTCVFSAPDIAGVDRSTTSVIVERSDGSAVLALNDSMGDCTEGWIWNDAGEIELCPATCASVESDPGSSVSVSQGCTTLVR